MQSKTTVRLPYPEVMERNPVDDSRVREVTRWIAERLLANGFNRPGGVWKALDTGVPGTRDEGFALHATLLEMVERCYALHINETSPIDDHYRRWAFNSEFMGIDIFLRKNHAPVDGEVFASIFDWPGATGGEEVPILLWYAPMKTLRSIEGWLRLTCESSGVPVHERAFLSRALGRLDSEAAVRLAAAIFDESPWMSSEVLGMYGGSRELDLLRDKVPAYHVRGMAENRRHIEAAIRKLERKRGTAEFIRVQRDFTGPQLPS